MLSSADVHVFQAGDLIGAGLRVEALLGQGGAGAVYRVRDETSGRRLALKQLCPPTDERRALVTSQFEREYHTLSQLAHPRIIEVYDYGFADGNAYYTMELLDGDDLHERGKLPWRTACALLCDVASSLAIVHSRGLCHRDVSARNVRCTADGRAKLIDFGAMAAMGVSHRVVGTPPFTPPEALQLQALDGRADLYGLGALAYWTLTGRHAYPARSFNQLRDLWRTPVVSPREREPELPEALGELVLALLRFDRSERPSSAAEVMERLSGIAGLALQELPQVSRAYLTMPKLVGRDTALQDVRAVLVKSAQASQGGGVLISGAAGSGRSRLLDACTLEAKLMGATVLRAGAGDAGSGNYGVAAALCRQLLQALPELCEQSAQPRRALLAQVLPELGDASTRARPAAERRHLQAALRDWLLAVTRTKHVVLAVDDCDAVDEPSAAWLGALAHGAKRRRLTLLLTRRAGGTSGAALSLLGELLSPIALEPLLPAQTLALLRSLFGDSPRLVALADRVHHASHGNPRRIMALAEHLVARGLARYEAGSWALPLELAAADLPESDREAIEQGLASLSRRARSLAEILSLTDPSALSLPDFAALSDAEGAGHSFEALDELVAAGILIPQGERHRLSQGDALAPLAAALDPQRLRALHARLAEVLQRGQAPAMLVQQHMLRGGRELDAIEQLLAPGPDSMNPALFGVLQLAVDTAERLQLSMRIQLQLQIGLVRLAAVIGRIDVFRRYGWPVMERLERDSGLLDWHEQDEATPSAERLAGAFARAERRNAELSEPARGFSPQESVLRLLGMYGATGTVASFTRDLAAIERIRPLTPWVGLSPLIPIVQASNQIQREIHRGRAAVATELCERLLQGLPRATPGEVDALGYLRFGNTLLLGILYAVAGDARCTRWAAELERQPGNRGNAWRVRMMYELMLGDLERARESRRRAELLDLQDTGAAAYPGTTAGVELIGYAHAGDLLGVKRAMEQVEKLAAAYPGWQPLLSIARCRYKWLQGQLEEALDALQPALAALIPGRHADWWFAAMSHLDLLVALGRHAEASALGMQHVAECERLNLTNARDSMTPSVALSLIRTGKLDSARALLSAAIDSVQRSGTRGFWSANLYATRARLAIAERDEAGLRRDAQLCAEQYGGGGDNRALKAQYERLMREGTAAGVVLAAQPEAGPAPDAHEGARTVYSRMLTCISPVERAQTGLQLLLEATGSKAGHLYGLHSGRLRLLSSADETAPPAGLEGILEDYLQRQLEDEGAQSARDASAAQALGSFLDELGREFWPLLLSARHQGERMIAGVAALYSGDDERPDPRGPMLEAIIEALIAQDIVDPITTHIA